MFRIMTTQLSLSDAHSGRILFFFMSSFKRSVHLSLGVVIYLSHWFILGVIDICVARVNMTYYINSEVVAYVKLTTLK